jgi:hypothetical protein
LVEEDQLRNFIKHSFLLIEMFEVIVDVVYEIHQLFELSFVFVKFVLKLVEIVGRFFVSPFLIVVDFLKDIANIAVLDDVFSIILDDLVKVPESTIIPYSIFFSASSHRLTIITKCLWLSKSFLAKSTNSIPSSILPKLFIISSQP